MISHDVRKKIGALQLHVKKILNNALIGDYRSAQKGYGLEFEQLRDYSLGDDIRFIDWKGTARTNKVLVKEYIHEYTKTILVAVDISGSGLFGSSHELKRDIIAQLATVLIFAAEHSKAHVGLVLFSDTVELFIPPASSKAHVWSILKKMWSHKPQGVKTNIKNVLNFLAKIGKKDTLLFFISDFIDQGFQKELGVVSQRYDMVLLRCLDNFEKELPSIGYLHMYDPELGKEFLINLKNTDEIRAFFAQRMRIHTECFKKYGIDYLDITINKPFMDPLIQFFARRILH